MIAFTEEVRNQLKRLSSNMSKEELDSLITKVENLGMKSEEDFLRSETSVDLNNFNEKEKEAYLGLMNIIKSGFFGAIFYD